MKKLTDGQYRFVCELISGKTREAAYATAYPKSRKWTRAVRDTTACRLLRMPHVQEFYSSEKSKQEESLRTNAQSKGIWDKQKSIEALTFVVGLAIQDAKDANKRRGEGDEGRVMTSTTANAIIKGVAELNRLLGIEADTKNDAQTFEPVRIIDDYRDGE